MKTIDIKTDNGKWIVSTNDSGILTIIENGLEERIALYQEIMEFDSTTDEKRKQLLERIERYKEYLKVLG